MKLLSVKATFIFFLCFHIWILRANMHLAPWHTHKHTHTHTHTYIYIYICICIREFISPASRFGKSVLFLFEIETITCQLVQYYNLNNQNTLVQRFFLELFYNPPFWFKAFLLIFFSWSFNGPTIFCSTVLKKKGFFSRKLVFSFHLHILCIRYLAFFHSQFNCLYWPLSSG